MSANDTRNRIIEHSGGHLRVLGPPGSGKTTLLLERYRWLERQGKRPAVITYGRAQQERLTDVLLGRGSAHMGRVPVWTFPRLAGDVLSVAEPGLRGPLREVQEMVLLDRVLAGLEGGLHSDYVNISASAAFRIVVRDVLRTMLQNGMNSDNARSALEAGGSTRARDLLRLFIAYRDLLDKRRITTFYDAPWRAASAVTPETNPLRDHDIVLVDDFGDIDAGQFELLLAAAPPNGSTEVDVFGDPTGARFGYRGTHNRFLALEFTTRYEPADEVLPPPENSPASVVVTSTLGTHASPKSEVSRGAEGQLGLFDAPAAQQETSPVPVPRLETFIADDEVAESQNVAERIAARLNDGRDVADIAVIARQPRRYERALTRAVSDRGIALVCTRRNYYAVDDYVDTWLRLLTTGPGERLIRRLTSSPFYERLRAHYATELDSKERTLENEEKDVREIIRVVKKQIPAGGFSMELLVLAAVRPVAGDGQWDLSVTQSVGALMDDWNRYEEAVRHVGGKKGTDLAEFRRICVSSDRSSGGEKHRPGVRFLSPLEASSQSFPIVFVMGCAENIFPAFDSSVGYVPFAELQRSMSGPYPLEFHGARDRDAKLRDEYALLVTALSRATEELYLSAPKEFSGEEVTAPSLILKDCFENAGRVGRLEGSFTTAARAIVTAGQGTYGSISEVHPGATAMEALWLVPPANAVAFTVDSFAMSPSRIGVYAKCPRRLLYERILRVKDEGSIYLTLGIVFHELMAKIGASKPSRAAVESLNDDEIERLVDEVCEKNSRDLGGRESLSRVSMQNYLVTLGRQFRGLEKLRVGDYRIGGVEANEAFTVAGLDFTGKVDRMDEYDGRTIVIDYKTSKDIHKTAKTIKAYAFGEKDGNRHWQIPFYSSGVKDETGRWPDVFCYYAFPPDDDPFVVGLFIADGDRHKSALKNFYDGPPKRFDSISPAEVEGLMKEAVTLTAEVFAERTLFARTDNHKHCGSCQFNRLCMRREA